MMAEIENWPWWVVWPGLAFGVLGGLALRDWAMSNSLRRTLGRRREGKREAELRRKLLRGIINRSKRRGTERKHENIA